MAEAPSGIGDFHLISKLLSMDVLAPIQDRNWAIAFGHSTVKA
jgi:hypothetical protein